MACIFSFN